MRADRLIRLLMLLQSHGRMTARRLARELEVTERTILRDIDALNTAGVPVFADRGPEGGFSLSPWYRSDLTGLTDPELRAIFLLSVPGVLADLGLDNALKSGLQKLFASLRERRDPGLRMRERYYLDPTSRNRLGSRSPHLERLAHAVNGGYRAHIAYRLPSGPVAEQHIHPYGLVAKEGAWYIVYLPEAEGQAPHDAATWVQALPLAAIVEVKGLGEPFTRRQDFDLVKAWEALCAADARPPYELWLLAPPEMVPSLDTRGLPCRVWEAVPPYADGRRLIAATAESFEDARAKVLTLGGAVEVVGPEALRRSVLDYAEQITTRYATPPPPHPDLPPVETVLPPLKTRRPRDY